MVILNEEEREVEELLGAVYETCGYDYRGYARAALRRRLRALAREERLDDVRALRERLVHDPDARERMFLALSSRPYPLFHEPELYRTLRRRLVPLLRTYPSAAVWLPGCGTGEEAWSTAIVLREEGLHERVRLYATDASEVALARARAGDYDADTMAAAAGAYAASGGRASLGEYYTLRDGRAEMRPVLRERIVFAQHNLATDASFKEFHLVVCRDVCLAFQPVLARRALGLIDESLCRLGFLALGRGESLRHHPRAEAYEEVQQARGVFRKVTA